MFAKDNPVKKWSVAPRGLTVCRVIFAWLNNYNIKADENKATKKTVRQRVSPDHLLLGLSLNAISVELIYIKNPTNYR